MIDCRPCPLTPTLRPTRSTRPTHADCLPSLPPLGPFPFLCLPALPRPADIEFGSPDVHYLCSITVNAGKVYAMFVKSPEKVCEGALGVVCGGVYVCVCVWMRALTESAQRDLVGCGLTRT